MDDRRERLGGVYPGEVSGARKQRHVAVTEKRAQLTNGIGGRPDIVLAPQQQGRHGQACEPAGQRRVRIEARVKAICSRLRELRGLGGCLGLCYGVPSPVQQRRRHPAIPLEFSRRCGLGVQGGDRVGVPGLVCPPGQYFVHA